MITKSKVEEWLQDEVTRAYFAGLRNQREGLAETVIGGSTLDFSNSDYIANFTAHTAGVARGLQIALDVDLENVIVDEEE